LRVPDKFSSLTPAKVANIANVKLKQQVSFAKPLLMFAKVFCSPIFLKYAKREPSKPTKPI